MEFDICSEALATLPKRGGYQSYDGWFYFNHDLKETYPTYKKIDFIIQMNEALKTQDIALVAVPLPGLGISNPEFLYREDTWQTTFSPAKAETNYRAFVQALREQGVEVVDALSAIQV